MTDYSLGSTARKRVQVWDVGVRLFHWSLVTTVSASYLLADMRALHRWLGYAVVGLIAFRLVWGLVGTRHARFTDFVPSPRGLILYLRDMIRGRETRHLGHNPAGAAMIIALLITLLAIGATGYMMGTDHYFGEEWVEVTHKTLVDFLILLVLCHVSGVVYSSVRHRENLAAAMITGQKDLHDGTPD
jgi:cytochrome b